MSESGFRREGLMFQRNSANKKKVNDIIEMFAGELIQLVDFSVFSH